MNMRSLWIGFVIFGATFAQAQDYAENNASAWGSYSTVDGGATSVVNDATHVREGVSALKFITASGFETGVTYPKTGSLGLDASAKNYFLFDVWPDNNTTYGFQGPQPILTVTTSTGTITLTPSDQLLANHVWNRIYIPLAGGQGWTRTTTGTPNLAQVQSFRLAFDTWDYGFSLYIDRVRFIHFDRSTPPPAGPPPPFRVDPNAVRQRVLALIIDPLMSTQRDQRVHEYFGWNDPVPLLQNALADLRRSSHYRYLPEIVDIVRSDDYPLHLDGYRYTDAEYIADTNAHNWHDSGMDYLDLMNKFNLASRVESGDIDEVWVYAFPGSGMWESTMAGAGAYWCNSGPVDGATNNRLFVIMGLNYERGIGEAIHSFGHRSESIMVKKYGGWPHDGSTAWSRFALTDQESPGQGGIGNVHFPVNGTSDYDYYNSGVVSSSADDWLNYPNMTGSRRMLGRGEWSPQGADPQREYLDWWYFHMPQAPGIAPDDILSNWWRYLIDVDQFKTQGNLHFITGIPTVVATPLTEATYGGKIRLNATASSDGPLGRVDFYVDGVFVGTDSLSPFWCDFDTRGIANGTHQFVAKAYDLWNQTEAISAPVNFTVQNSGPPLRGQFIAQYWGDYRTLNVQMDIIRSGSVVQTLRPVLDSQGRFATTCNVAAGAATLRIRTRRFLDRQIPIVIGSPDMPNITLLGGDADGDNAVTVFDYGLLSDYFDLTSAEPNWNQAIDDDLTTPSCADFDGDGEISVFDYGILSDHFDLTGD